MSGRDLAKEPGTPWRYTLLAVSVSWIVVSIIWFLFLGRGPEPFIGISLGVGALVVYYRKPPLWLDMIVAIGLMIFLCFGITLFIQSSIATQGQEGYSQQNSTDLGLLAATVIAIEEIRTELEATASAIETQQSQAPSQESLEPDPTTLASELARVRATIQVLETRAAEFQQTPETVPGETSGANTSIPVMTLTPETVVITDSRLVDCPSIGPMETVLILPGTFIKGDIVIDGVRQHDWREEEATVAYFDREASVFAQWEVGCSLGGYEHLDQVIAGEYATGCGSGCTRVRSVIVRPDGRQEVLCHYPDGTTANLQGSGDNTFCPP